MRGSRGNRTITGSTRTTAGLSASISESVPVWSVCGSVCLHRVYVGTSGSVSFCLYHVSTYGSDGKRALPSHCVRQHPYETCVGVSGRGRDPANEDLKDSWTGRGTTGKGFGDGETFLGKMEEERKTGSCPRREFDLDTLVRGVCRRSGQRG